MKKVHIRDYKRTFHGESYTIGFSRCGNQINVARDKTYTPIDSDTDADFKKANVCKNCVRTLRRAKK